MKYIPVYVEYSKESFLFQGNFMTNASCNKGLKTLFLPKINFARLCRDVKVSCPLNELYLSQNHPLV